MQKPLNHRLLLCVLLSLVVHAGFAATFVSAIRSELVHLEIVNPIKVSLVHDVSDAIGTTASQSVESDLDQFFVSGTQPNSIDPNQLADNSADSANEVTDELVSAAVASADANQPTDISDNNQPTPPLPTVKNEEKKEIPDAEVQPTRTKSSDISPSTERLSEPNELKSTESAYVKAEEEPLPRKSESVQDLHLTEPVKYLTNQVTNSRIDSKIEYIAESDQDLVSYITPFEFSHFEMHESAEVAVDNSDADEHAGILSSAVVEPATTKFDQPPVKESSPEKIVESQIQVADIAELSHPVSITAIEVVQLSPSEMIDDEHITDEIASTSSLETESDIDEQFTNEPHSNIPQTAYSRIDDEIERIWEFEHQADSDIPHAGSVDSPLQTSAGIAVDNSDADELAGIWPTEAIEPATTKFDQPPVKEPSPEKFVESQIQVADIAEMSHPVSITAIEVVQFSPSEMIDGEHITDEVASTSSLETKSNIDEQLNDNAPSDIIQITYSTIEAKIDRSMETDYQPVSNITPVENSSVSVLSSAELVAEKRDADELAGIWPTEAKEPAIVDSDQLPSSEVAPQEIVASQIQVANATDLIKTVQHDANQVEPENLPAPTFSGFGNQSDNIQIWIKRLQTKKLSVLNDSWITDQVPSATDHFAYAPPKLEPTPIRDRKFMLPTGNPIGRMNLKEKPTHLKLQPQSK